MSRLESIDALRVGAKERVDVPGVQFHGICRREWFRHALCSAAAASSASFTKAIAQSRPPTHLLTFRHTPSGGPDFLFIGTRHTFDRDHPELDGMKTLIRQFKPDVALMEGGNWPIDLELADLVSRHGEMAFAKKLCSDLGALTQDADPPFELELRHVADQFDIRLVKLFYVLRMVPGFLARNAGQAAEQLRMWMNLPQLNLIPQMREVITTEQELNDALHSFAPGLRSWRDAEDTMVIAPTGRRSILNEVARRSLGFRDEHAVSAVIAHMKQGRRVLLVMGAGHVEALEGNLRRRLDTALAR